jgi:hypothetical protein
MPIKGSQQKWLFSTHGMSHICGVHFSFVFVVLIFFILICNTGIATRIQNREDDQAASKMNMTEIASFNKKRKSWKD